MTVYIWCPYQLINRREGYPIKREVVCRNWQVIDNREVFVALRLLHILENQHSMGPFYATIKLQDDCLFVLIDNIPGFNVRSDDHTRRFIPVPGVMHNIINSSNSIRLNKQSYIVAPWIWLEYSYGIMTSIMNVIKILPIPHDYIYVMFSCDAKT